MSYIGHLKEIGSSALGRAVNATLYVSPSGSGTNGLTWASAYQTIQAALDAASTDGDDATLIMISPHATNYDIDTTGDPTWAGNYILANSSRSWAKVKNTHASATSIMKFTGKAMLKRINFNLGSGSGNGVILTHGGSRVFDCMFIGEDLTGAATGLHVDGATAKHGKIVRCEFLGDGRSYFTAILLDNCSRTWVEDVRIHEGLAGIQIIHANSDSNIFHDIDIGGCGIGFDLDAGNEQHFYDICLHDNTTNIDDEVHDHIYKTICGQFPMTIEPDDFNGVTVTAHANANTWGADTEIRAAATSTKPFRIVSVAFEPGVSQWYRVRFSDDSGSTHYDDIMVDATKNQGGEAPSGTEYIFNTGTRISASAKAASGGSDTIQIWLKIQEI